MIEYRMKFSDSSTKNTTPTMAMFAQVPLANHTLLIVTATVEIYNRVLYSSSKGTLPPPVWSPMVYLSQETWESHVRCVPWTTKTTADLGLTGVWIQFIRY